MYCSAHFAALAALGFIPIIQAVPVIESLTTVSSPVSSASSSTAGSFSFIPAFDSESYLPYTYASISSSSSVSLAPSDSIQWNVVSSPTAPSISLVPTPAAGVSGTLPPFTVVTETFTIPLGSSSTTCSGTAFVPSAKPTLSSVLATFTIPYGNSSTTLLHTFTYTPSPSSPVSASFGWPFPTTSVSMPPLPSQSLSIESASSVSSVLSVASVSSVASEFSKSISSQESVFVSFLSALTQTFGSQSLQTLPVTETGKREPMSEVTASFTVTLPTGKPMAKTTFASPWPTFTGPMITASFTLTLPPPPKTTKTVETPKVSTTSDTTCTPTPFSSSTSETKTTRSKHTTHTWPETRTYTLSTKVTFTLSPTAPTSTGPTGTGASSLSPVPSGTGAITLTYTLPGGPGRASQVVTITTVRPAGPVGTGTGTVSGFPSGTGTGTAASGTGFPRSSLSWSLSRNSTSYSPTGSGLGTGTGTTVSILPTGHLPNEPLPASSLSSTIVVTATATATKVSVVTLTRTYIQTQTALADNFTPPGKPLEVTTMFVTIARRSASPSACSMSSSGDPIFTVTWPSESSSASSSAGATSSISSSAVWSSVSSSVSSSASSSSYSSDFGPVIASPVPIARSIHKVRRAPACEDNNVIINFDGDTKLTPDRNDPVNELHFGTGFSRIDSRRGDAFKASSKPGLLQFVPSRFGGATSGEIKTANACMRFNLNSFTIGCSTLYAECRVNVKGMRTIAGVDETVAAKTFTVPQVPQLVNNDMQLISIDSKEFTNLTSAVVSIDLDGPPFPSWFMDDLSVDFLCIGSCPTRRSLEHGEAQKSGAIPYWRKSS